MKLRTVVTQADVAAIRKMVAEAGVFSPEEIDVAEELAQDSATLGERSDYHFILADVITSEQRERGNPAQPHVQKDWIATSPSALRDDGSILAGYTCYGRIPLTDERYDLYWIVTDVKSSRKGVAAELMRQTETAVQRLGGKAIYAETSSRAIYAPAQRFYEKTGFTLAARVKDFYKTGDDKLLYSKFL